MKPNNAKTILWCAGIGPTHAGRSHFWHSIDPIIVHTYTFKKEETEFSRCIQPAWLVGWPSVPVSRSPSRAFTYPKIWKNRATVFEMVTLLNSFSFKKHFLISKYLARYTKHLCICTAFLHVYVVCKYALVCLLSSCYSEVISRYICCSKVLCFMVGMHNKTPCNLRDSL